MGDEQERTGQVDVPGGVMPWHMDNADAAKILEKALGQVRMLGDGPPAGLTGGKADAMADLLRRATLAGNETVGIDPDPKRPTTVNPWSRPWYQYPDVESLDAAAGAAGLGYGAVVTYRANPAASAARVVHHDTGDTWARGLSGRWRRLHVQATSPAMRVALLLLDPQATADAVAQDIRQTITPWETLLDQGRAAALNRAQDMPADVAEQVVGRCSLARAILAATDGGPHRIVMVVEDAAVMAASLDADADLAAASPMCLGLRAHAAAVRRAGVGRVELPDVYPSRRDASDSLLRLRSNRRPGQTFVMEPCPVQVPA